MTTQGTIPPGERDLEIYRLVKVEQKSTRIVAEIVGISQTRVCQIVERVADFMIETAPTGEKDPQLQKQVNFARQLAGERIDYLITQALHCFHNSKGMKATIRQVEVAGQSPATVTTKRESQGDVKYLLAIARLAVIGSKLPAGGMGRDWDAGGEVREVRIGRWDARCGMRGKKSIPPRKGTVQSRRVNSQLRRIVLSRQRT